MATCSPSSLMQDAKCFCSITRNPFELAELQLLCNIFAVLAGGSGGSGLSQVYQYPSGSDPNTAGIVPLNQSFPAIAVPDDGNGSWFEWRTDTLTWV